MKFILGLVFVLFFVALSWSSVNACGVPCDSSSDCAECCAGEPACTAYCLTDPHTLGAGGCHSTIFQSSSVWNPSWSACVDNCQWRACISPAGYNCTGSGAAAQPEIGSVMWAM